MHQQESDLPTILGGIALGFSILILLFTCPTWCCGCLGMMLLIIDGISLVVNIGVLIYCLVAANNTPPTEDGEHVPNRTGTLMACAAVLINGLTLLMICAPFGLGIALQAFQ